MTTTVNATVLDTVAALARMDDGAPLDGVAAEAAGLAMLNAVQAQQADNILADAALARVVALMLDIARSPIQSPPAAKEPPHV